MFEWKESRLIHGEYQTTPVKDVIYCHVSKLKDGYSAAVQVGSKRWRPRKNPFTTIEEAKAWCEETALAKAKELIVELAAFVEEVEK